MTKRKFTKSRIVRWNMVFATIGAVLTGLPDLLTQLLALLGSPEIQSALAFLPPKYRALLETVTRVAGALMVLSSVITMRERVKSAGGKIAGPKLRLR